MDNSILAATNDIGELKQRIKELETELEEWKDELKVTRQMKNAHWASYKKQRAENQRLREEIKRLRKPSSKHYSKDYMG